MFAIGATSWLYIIWCGKECLARSFICMEVISMIYAVFYLMMALLLIIVVLNLEKKGLAKPNGELSIILIVTGKIIRLTAWAR